MTVTVSKWVDVEVDLDEFETDELIEELQSRGITDVPTDLNIQRQAMLKALWDKDEAKAIDLLKTYLCDCLGRVTV